LKEKLKSVRISFCRRTTQQSKIYYLTLKIMQKKKLIATGIVALFLLTVIPSTYAFGGFGKRGGEQKNFNSEKHAAVQEAFENSDYDAFIEATGRTNLTEERFEEMVAKKAEQQARREAVEDILEAGDYEAWQDLHEKRFEEMFSEDRFDLMVEMHEAIENEDYEKMKELREEMHEDGFGRGMGMMGGGNRGKGFGGFHR
jgi:hypothetical protein